MNSDPDSVPQHTISTLGEILEEFIRYGKTKIAEYEAEGFEIKHGPTIGNIYEGLTSDVINRAVPSSLNLRVTNGFVSGKGNKTSGQIDCMLVKGVGKIIPNTAHEIVQIEDVLVVFEVKKSLYGASLPDILDHFNQLMQLEPFYPEGIDADIIFRTFAQITGVHLESRKAVEELPFHQQLVYHSLVSEHVRPVRIAISYNGFKSEANFRKAFTDLLKANVGRRWIPPTHWPDLIVSGDFSLVKLNGRPYATPSQNGLWDLYGTTRASPIRLMLELIYTKIAKDADVVDFWGDDLETETINPFLQAEAVEVDGKHGWKFEQFDLSDSQLATEPAIVPWSPFIADEEEGIFLHLLCQSPDGLEDSIIREGIGDRTDALIDRLKKTGLVAQRGSRLVLTTCEATGGFLPDGRFFFGENNTGRLIRWVMNESKLIRARKNVDAKVDVLSTNTPES